MPLLPILLGTLGASLLTGRELFRAGKGMYRAGNQGLGVKKKSLTPFHPLTNFEIQDYFKNEKRFNGVFSRNNLPKLKKEALMSKLMSLI